MDRGLGCGSDLGLGGGSGLSCWGSDDPGTVLVHDFLSKIPDRVLINYLSPVEVRGSLESGAEGNLWKGVAVTEVGQSEFGVLLQVVDAVDDKVGEGIWVEVVGVSGKAACVALVCCPVALVVLSGHGIRNTLALCTQPTEVSTPQFSSGQMLLWRGFGEVF